MVSQSVGLRLFSRECGGGVVEALKAGEDLHLQLVAGPPAAAQISSVVRVAKADSAPRGQQARGEGAALRCNAGGTSGADAGDMTDHTYVIGAYVASVEIGPSTGGQDV